MRNVILPMKILLFGAGARGKEVIRIILGNKDLYRDNYIGFVDNDKNKAGGKIEDKTIFLPKVAMNMNFDYVVLSVADEYQNEIKEQVMYEWNVSGEKILLFHEYEKMCFCRKQYIKQYPKKRRKNAKNVNDIVVYTAITGGYDDLHEPLYFDEDLRYICFTNNRELKSDKWEVIYVDNEGLSDVYLARRIKMFPHLYLPSSKASIWIDGKLQILNDLRDIVNQYGADSAFLCFSHFERECIYDEAVTCIQYKKATKEKIVPQITAYYKDGYPFNAGLYETGFIYRRHNEQVKNLMDCWWREIRLYSHRDQVSLPYVCWKNDFKPDISDIYIYKNKYMKYIEHKSN